MRKKEKEPAKEIGVWNVTCWIFVGLAILFSIFSAVVTIKAGQIFVGLLFFIPGIFAAVPKEYLRISRPLKVIIFLVVYFTLLIISGINAPKLEQQYEYYNLGDSFNLTYGEEVFSMKINNIAKETQITIEGGQNINTSGFYLLVNGGITNLGKTTFNNAGLFGVKFVSELRDSSGNTYTLFATNNRVNGFQPNLEKQFKDIFEISKQASGLKFFVKDKTEIIKVVNLE
ncbi:MAG: hypothetical protein KKB79_02695 [Nanoarchaeota archaeon]|nr:hypothetical protein [Nanoarchaeota archaeon]